MNRLCFEKKLPLSLAECWDFFSTPNNLQKLTPAYLGFSSDYANQETMYAGQIIIHHIRPILGIAVKWVTEITHVDKPHYFIDEQRFGPYKFWHHEHRFKSINQGVEIMDIIHYELPLGIIGTLINAIKVKRDIEAIFHYRTNKLNQLFGTYSNPVNQAG